MYDDVYTCKSNINWLGFQSRTLTLAVKSLGHPLRPIPTPAQPHPCQRPSSCTAVRCLYEQVTGAEPVKPFMYWNYKRKSQRGTVECRNLVPPLWQWKNVIYIQFYLILTMFNITFIWSHFLKTSLYWCYSFVSCCWSLGPSVAGAVRPHFLGHAGGIETSSRGILVNGSEVT